MCLIFLLSFWLLTWFMIKEKYYVWLQFFKCVKVLWPSLWCVLMHYPWALEKNVYFTGAGCSVKSCWLDGVHLSYPCCFSLGQFYKLVREGRWSPQLYLDLSISPFSSISFCLMYFEDYSIFLLDWSFYLHVMSLAVSSNTCCFEI